MYDSREKYTKIKNKITNLRNLLYICIVVCN